MKTNQNQYFADLKPVRRQLEDWRRTRKPHRIPQAIWSALARVARRHGVSRVARALRVEFYALRDHTAAAQGLEANLAPGAFVEIPLAMPSAPAGCVVELEDGRGWKMTLRLASANGADAAALVEAFGRRRV